MPTPADSAHLFVKNFDEDIISDPDELKKLLELYGPRLKLHFGGKDGFRSDGKEYDRGNPDSTYARSSDNGEDGSTEGTEKEEQVGSIEKEPLSPPLEETPNRPEDGLDQDAIRESPEVSQIDEGSEQEQDTTSGTGWRGSTELAGMSNNANYGIEVTEVQEEEVETETTYGDNIATYAEPALPPIHDRFLDALSGQIKEEMLQSESTQLDAPGEILRPSNSATTIALQDRTMAVVAMDYNITIIASHPFSFMQLEEPRLTLGVGEDKSNARMPVLWFWLSELGFMMLLSPSAPMGARPVD
ncbi:hypothetical protein B9Z19DRAFT_1064795 [Tuber borchii]|uniref:Uncharacterized protein n=1 Tax=Tuber borchii TaxID=42251 RepID=A0A2T6ZTF9_TUBBO|nr:hypothetical protein B9Z19DRAFT_1064795 [Tuber borchii]